MTANHSHSFPKATDHSNIEDGTEYEDEEFRRLMDSRGITLDRERRHGGHSFDDYRANGALKDAFAFCLSSLQVAATQKAKALSTIALDLEGTLISHASTLVPRPGLYQFMEFCQDNFTRIVFFSFVEQERGRVILQQMVDSGNMPDWVVGAEYVTAIGGRPGAKDLRLLDVEPENALLIDDQIHVVPLDQRPRLIQIAEFKATFPDDDKELERVRQVLEGLLKERG